MREIKFRGKVKYNGLHFFSGDFIEGYYAYKELDKKHIVLVERAETTRYASYFVEIEVDAETVGQYTGLKDKNGVEIYEGDILHWDSHWGWYVGFENGAFRRIPLNDIQKMNWKHYALQQEGLDTWEVIDNIHDNPELLEVE